MDTLEITERATLVRRQSRLKWYEDEIEKRGRSLSSIFRELRDDREKPYLATHDSFDAYCRERWNMTPRRAQQLLAADTVRAQLSDAVPELAPAIGVMKEGAIREFVTTPPEKRVAVLRSLVGQPGRNTAAKIKMAKARVISSNGKPEPEARCCPTCKRPL